MSLRVLGVVVEDPPGEGWLACSEPERPVDPDTRWHIFGNCRACSIKFVANEAITGRPRPEFRRLVCEPA